MNSGGSLDLKTSHSAKLIALIAPVLLLGYGLMAMADLVPSFHFISSWWFALLMIVWIGYALYRIFTPYSAKEKAWKQLVVYHIFFLLYLVLVSGFNSPITTAWIVLSLVAYFYYSSYGLTLSACLLLLAALLDMFLRSYSLIEFTLTFLGIIIVVLVSVAAAAINSFRANEHSALQVSRKRHDLERERVLTIINNLADAVYSTDGKGIIQVYNAAGLSLLDTNEAISGKHINDIMKPTDAEGRSVDIYQLFRKARSVVVNDDLRLQFGEDVMRLELTYAPIRSSYTTGEGKTAGEGYIMIARDITRVKSLEEERDEFISVVSHELRTPVTVAEGTISNAQLMMQRQNTDPAKIQNSLDEAHEQVLFLAKMINDLSTLSRAERGVASEVETIDVAELARSLHGEYGPQAVDAKLHFNLELGTHLGSVTTSRLYLHELLQNFITNAIKYTHEGSVTLKITKSAGHVHFVVSDTGIGISKSDQAKIFEKFYRSEDYRTRETGGTGLGLYVATKLAKKIGTTIELKSRLNHGSTFSFSLPAAKK